MKKKIIIISLIFVLFLMSAGYSVYSGILKINGTSNIDSNFLVEVTNIKEESKTGKAVSVTEPTYTKSTASFNAKLSRPGDNIEYEVTLSNNGTIDSKINNIVITNPSSIIKVETRGISKGQILKSGENLKYIVRVYIDENSKITEDVTEKIEVSTDLIQDDNQIFNEGVDGVTSSKLEIKSISLTSSYTSITSSISAKGEGLKYYYSLDNENFVEGTSSYTFNNLEVNKRYTIYYKIEDSKNNYVTESKYINTKDLDNSTITVENEDTFTTSKKVTISFPSIDGAKYYYKIGNNDYIETTSIKELTLSENTTIYTKIEAGSSSLENKKEITKIDNETPELNLTTSSTSKSITVVANTSSISGISKYEFSTDGSTWIDNKTYNNYTFKDLTHNTSYTFYVRVTSNTNKTVTKSVTVTTKKIETPTFTQETTDEGRVVVITFPEGCNEEYTCSYIKNSEEEVVVTEKTKKVTFTETGTIIAKVNDGKNYITSSTYTVIIDKTILSKMNESAVIDNIASTYVSSSSGINFKNLNSDTNGKGIYIRAGTENDTYPVYYYRGKVTNNNVLFGNFCWKIVRTTSKGGIKLVYNGMPQTDDNGNFSSCNNTGTASQLSSTSAFYSNYKSPADVGYMYGTRYTYILKTVGTSYWYTYAGKSTSTQTIVSQKSGMSSTSYYYGDSVTENSDGTYTLENASAYRWRSKYSSLKGYYTCFSTSSTCSSKPSYIAGSTSLYAYYVSYDKKTISMSKTVDYLSSSYTLSSPTYVDAKDYYSSYSSYKSYYYCSDLTSTTCSSVRYATSTSSTSITYVNMAGGETYDTLYQTAKDTKWVYGNDVEYDEATGKYKLKTTTLSSPVDWDSDRSTLATNSHYTCLSTSNTCSSVYYIYYFGDSEFITYLTLSSGKDIEDVKNEMFSNINKSTIKTAVDNWYASNMTDYTNYLEDEEWCVDRTFYKGPLTSKDIGDTGYNYFGAFQRTHSTYNPSVTCPNDSDKLSVSRINNSSLMPYPVALLTTDEIIMAGVGAYSSQSSYYLYTGKEYWLLSPFNFDAGCSGVFNVNSSGGLSGNYVNRFYGVRPSIVLKQGLEVKSGTDGSYTNPYQVILN